MKRSSIALCIGVWLVACSGQRNESTKSLGSGNRDAEADAEETGGEDAEVTPREDAEVDAGAESDTGTGGDIDAGSSDASAGNDGSLANDGSTATDSAAPPDAQVDATPQGDASAELRIRVTGWGRGLDNVPILFSQADGGYVSDHITNAEGVYVSGTAPGQVTIALPGEYSQLNQREQMLTVIAPALGDFIDIDVSALLARPPTNQTPYVLTAQPTPTGLAEALAYAGSEGCAQAYKQFVPATTDAFLMGRNAACVVENGGAVIARGVDDEGDVVHYAGGTLGVPGTSSPTAVTLGPWLSLETLSASMANIPTVPTRSSNAYLWLRKGALRVPVNLSEAVAGAYPFPVARSIVDSFDVDFWIDGSNGRNDHLFRKNVAAASPNVTFDYASVLLEVLDDEFVDSSLLRPTANWTLEGNATSSGDVAAATISWNWMPNSDSVAYLRWVFLGPADMLSVTPPELPTTGRFGLPLVPTGAERGFEGVTYYDSDQQSNLRDFLKEPLLYGPDSGSRRVDFRRNIPAGATLRAMRYLSPGPI